jgi:hypothetical protein
MKAEIENALSVLNGKALWACGRAADLASFQFGRRIPRNDFFGKPTQIGEYALHVQCAWRIVRGDRVLVGSRDLYYPAEYENEHEEFPSDFDWDRDPNRRDKLLRSLFEDGRREFMVERVEVGTAGTLRILLTESLALDVFPEDSLKHERWRLLCPERDEPHLVVTGYGVET